MDDKEIVSSKCHKMAFVWKMNPNWIQHAIQLLPYIILMTISSSTRHKSILNDQWSMYFFQMTSTLYKMTGSWKGILKIYCIAWQPHKYLYSTRLLWFPCAFHTKAVRSIFQYLHIIDYHFLRSVNFGISRNQCQPRAKWSAQERKTTKLPTNLCKTLCYGCFFAPLGQNYLCLCFKYVGRCYANSRHIFWRR